MQEEQGQKSQQSISYILLKSEGLPDLTKLSEQSVQFGLADISWTTELQGAQAKGQLAGTGEVLVVFVAVPPRLTLATVAPTSPTKAEMAAATSHYVVSLSTSALSVLQHDRMMAKLIAALLKSSPSLGALMGHCGAVHRPEVFTEYIPLLPEAKTPVPGAIDFTMAKCSQTHMAFLSYGMERYQRENLLLTVPQGEGQWAYDYALDVATWLLESDEVPASGAYIQIGKYRPALVQRKPDPRFSGSQMIVLELGPEVSPSAN